MLKNTSSLSDDRRFGIVKYNNCIPISNRCVKLVALEILKKNKNLNVGKYDLTVFIVSVSTSDHFIMIILN